MSYAGDFETLSGRVLIDGQYRLSAAADRFDIVNPATEAVVGHIADATDEEIDQAIAAASIARKSWQQIDMRSRATMLHEVAALIRANAEDYAYNMVIESGKPFKEARDEASWCASAIDYYAEVARHDTGRIVGETVPGQFHFCVNEPLGTVVIVLPYNFPLVLLSWEMSAAIAAGNAVIVKPHEQTSITTLKFLEVFASLPAGLVQCITGGPRVAQRLIASENTHGVAYTGSVEVGRIVARLCAETFKPALIEASGNDAFIVMPSAPLDIAARAAAFAANLNCGQVCTSAERFYVHESIHDEFVSLLVAAVKKLRIGNGLDEVDIGPMATSRQRDRFEATIAKALGEGATLAAGGGRPAAQEKGWFVEPVVLTGVTQEMTIMNEESFGPVAPICKVKDFDEALRYANASRFGLGSYLYTRDTDETFRAVREIESGIVWINAPTLDNDALPFGGRKLSGKGSQLGSEGLRQFQNSKFVMIDPAAKAQDFWWFPYSQEESYKG